MLPLRCQIGVLGLSLKLLRNISGLPNDPRAAPQCFGGSKKICLLPRFSDGEQLLILLPLFLFHPAFRSTDGEPSHIDGGPLKPHRRLTK